MIVRALRISKQDSPPRTATINRRVRKDSCTGSWDGIRRRPLPAPGQSSADASRTRVSVKQVRRSIAVQRQHLVPTEYVIALTIRQQVGVFDSANADNSRDL